MGIPLMSRGPRFPINRQPAPDRSRDSLKDKEPNERTHIGGHAYCGRCGMDFVVSEDISPKWDEKRELYWISCPNPYCKGEGIYVDPVYRKKEKNKR